MSTANPAKSESGSSAVAKQRMRSIMQTAGMLPVLVLLAILFQFLSAYGDTGTFDWSAGRFLTENNLPVVAQLASINTVLATGMTFVILTGGIDLSVGSILAVSAMSALIAANAVKFQHRHHPDRPAGRRGLRPAQRHADLRVEAAALHRDPGLADGRARPRPAVRP